MKTAIITIAGLSSRFNQDVEPEERKLKAIYYENNELDTLLFHMIDRMKDSDRIVLVAGYKKEDLRDYIERVFPQGIKEKISIVINDHYEDWSSGYSLYLGIKDAFRYGTDSILFAEGDLDVDNETFKAVSSSTKSVITCNHEVIRSNKAVIGYCNADGKYRYAFSESHGLASVNEQFSLLFNSGQVWKFTNMNYLEDAISEFETVKDSGTNLVIVSGYFEKEDPKNVELLDFKYWVNCNTKEDYRDILAVWEEMK